MAMKVSPEVKKFI